MTEVSEQRAMRSRWRRLVVWAVVAVLVFLLVETLAGVSWPDVASALDRLTVLEVAALLGVVAIRVVVAAVPLHVLVPGLGLRRAAQNDLAATLVATAMPSPSDIVLRLAMFDSWGVDPVRGMTGLVLQSLLFYLARLAAPVAGFGLILVGTDQVDPVLAGAALTSGLLAIAWGVGLWVAVRSEASARRLGSWGAAIVGRVRPRPGLVDWPDRVAGFQSGAGHLLRHRGPAVEAAYAGLLLLEAVLLVLALRFVGVTSAEASALLVVAALLCVYPLTGLPLLGLGVLDAALVALLAAEGGADQDALVAGVIVWRVAFQLVPLAIGVVALTRWRRGVR